LRLNIHPNLAHFVTQSKYGYIYRKNGDQAHPAEYRRLVILIIGLEVSMRELINGTQAIVRGAIHSGCNFFAGYPITPATDILLSMIRELPKVGGVAIQAEDEIASMGFCIGAAMTGRRVMTATSGPGISLYSENIGLAIMGEVPMVIVDVQRMGPATGGATTVGQGDIQFLRWGTSGGYPVIVLSPTSVSECYRLTCKAFDLAERFRVPVFLATDKETVLTLTTVDVKEFVPVPVRERKNFSAEGEFIPYHVESPDEVPEMAPYGGANLLRFTTSTHDEHGQLTKTPLKVRKLNERLSAKVEMHLDETSMVKADLQPGAETLIVSYGVTSRAVTEAVYAAREMGQPVSSLIIHSLWPVPEKEIKQALEGIRKVIVPELNLGQYRLEVERIAREEVRVIGISRVDGELISPEEILVQGGLR
jgi:2-oxoglutarate/2-oxoacid ferredoxin oxidoreductase subunit alpha